MANNLRAPILKGFAAANRIHQKYNLSGMQAVGGVYLDVFDIIQREGVFLCFTPLENLHGAYLPANGGREGILVNSKHRARMLLAFFGIEVVIVTDPTDITPITNAKKGT